MAIKKSELYGSMNKKFSCLEQRMVNTYGVSPT